MRIYEIAKELGVVSKDLLIFLKSAGFDVASHMSVLSDEALDAIKKKYSVLPVKETREKFEKKVDEKNISIKPGPQQADQVNKPSHGVARKEPVVQSHEKQNKPIAGLSAEQRPAQSSGVITAEEKVLLEKVAFGDAPEIIAEELNLDALSKGREKIDRFLVKRSSDVGGRPFRRRTRRRRPRIIESVAPKIVSQVDIERNLPLCEAADLMGKTSGELITALIKRGLICNRNHVLTPEQIKSLADGFGIKASIVAVTQTTEDTAMRGQMAKSAQSKHQVSRWPIVVVMGHVDHGKTTLLDYIRKMNVAASERGGITQHLGAYEVASTHGKIVFLDTPGHEAFSYMRERGSRVTDLVVLVVAADDGIMPQTVEAIKHAKAAEVPIIVAINKIDKVQSSAAIETIKRQLAQYELMPEDWGGQTVVVPISAKTGKGIDNLLELIVLQSQLMELKADATTPAKAFVLESKVERGYGPVATVICTEGTLKQGDFFTCGGSAGKVRLLINSVGARIQSAGPSVPVQVVGFDSFSAIGDWLVVVPQEVYSKARANKPVEQTSLMDSGVGQSIMQHGGEKRRSINLVIKTDTRGSKEALMGCIEKLAKLSKEVKCPVFVISSGIGDISESDVDFAASTNSMIIGLHVKQEKNAIALSKQKNVVVWIHHIIYHLIEELEKLLQSKKEAEIIWNKVGEAVVKRVFDIKGVGVIAGCYMRDGILARDHKVVCMRDGRKLGEGKVTSLQRDKKTVKEIHAGFECGFMCDGFNDWAEGDTVLCYMQTKEKQR